MMARMAGLVTTMTTMTLFETMHFFRNLAHVLGLFLAHDVGLCLAHVFLVSRLFFGLKK